MNELTTLLQSVPWLWIGIALVAINLVLLALKITKKLIVLAIGIALVAIGIYTGIIDPSMVQVASVTAIVG
ncbi:MAG TPA: hypothetical protein H9832_03710 [Candidatus Agathobaculum merdavium]|nr:hypothetical protein [Candidatus Agathobaculum merdavium]